MKLYKMFLLCLFSCLTTMYSFGQQSITVIYQEKYSRMDNLKKLLSNKNQKELPVKLQSLLKTSINDMSPQDSIAHFYSLYYSRGKSVFRYDSTQGKGIRTAPEFYKDHIANKLVMVYSALVDKQAETPLQSPGEWDICYEDTLLISGYTAFKATCIKNGKALKVWFTPDIPISDGPGRYSGLPGLILILERPDNMSLKATRVLIENHAAKAIQIPDRPVKMTFEALKEAMKKTMF